MHSQDDEELLTAFALLGSATKAHPRSSLPHCIKKTSTLQVRRKGSQQPGGVACFFLFGGVKPSQAEPCSPIQKNKIRCSLLLYSGSFLGQASPVHLVLLFAFRPRLRHAQAQAQESQVQDCAKPFMLHRNAASAAKGREAALLFTEGKSVEGR